MKPNGEMIIVLFILSWTVIPLLLIGIVQFRKKERPVGFWAGVEPPPPERVTDVRAYNRKHGMMWIVYSVGLAVFFLSGYVIDMDGLWSALFGGGWAVGGILVMMVYHTYLEKKYVRTDVYK